MSARLILLIIGAATVWLYPVVLLGVLAAVWVYLLIRPEAGQARYLPALALAVIAVPLMIWKPFVFYALLFTVALVAAAAYASNTSQADRLAARNPHLKPIIDRASRIRGWMIRRRFTRRWARALHRAKLPPARILSFEETAIGVRAAFQCKPGITPGGIEKARHGIASSFRARDVKILGDSTDASRGTASVIYRDLLTEPLGQPPWMYANQTSTWTPIPIGVDEHGLEVTLSLPYKTLLVGGVPGSGKTSLLHCVIAWAALDPNTSVYIADGKELDFGIWRDACASFAYSPASDLEATLAAATGWMADRKRQLQQEGREKVRPGDPLALLIVDEITAYPILKARQKQPYKDLQHCIARGRAVGLVAIVSTQRPDVEAIDGAIRDNIDLRLAFRCRTSDASDTILSRGSAQAGYDASGLPDSPGLALADTGHKPQLMRCYYARPEDLRAQVQSQDGRWRSLSAEPEPVFEPVFEPHSDPLAEPADPPFDPLVEPPAEPVAEPPVFVGGSFPLWYRRTYLTSDYWRLRSARERERVGDRCETCGNSGELHVHHTNYDGVGRGAPEREGQLAVLCRACHKRAERNRKVTRQPPPKERAMDLLRSEPQLTTVEVMERCAVSQATVKRARRDLKASSLS